MATLRTYILKRIFLWIPTILLLTVLTFTVAHVIPIDPAAAWAGSSSITGVVQDEATIQRLEEKYHLNDPIPVQYWYYITALLQGDMGESPVTGNAVAYDIKNYFPHTLELTINALILALVVGIPLGIVSAVKKDKLVDHFSRFFSLIGVSIPIFWVGLLFIMIFYVYLDVLPPTGAWSDHQPARITGMYWYDTILLRDWVGFKDVSRHMILPTVTLSYSIVAYFSRLVRSSMLEILSLEYITTARSKGLSERVVLYRHALRNSMLPLITMAGLMFGTLLGGAVLTETIFSWPGIGWYAASASLRNLDYPAIMGVTLVSGIAFSLVNLIVDVIYGIIDPRIRLG